MRKKATSKPWSRKCCAEPIAVEICNQKVTRLLQTLSKTNCIIVVASGFFNIKFCSLQFNAAKSFNNKGQETRWGISLKYPQGTYLFFSTHSSFETSIYTEDRVGVYSWYFFGVSLYSLLIIMRWSTLQMSQNYSIRYI